MLKDREIKGDEARAWKLRRRDLERSDLGTRDEAIEKKLREHETLRMTYYAYCDEYETQGKGVWKIIVWGGKKKVIECGSCSRPIKIAFTVHCFSGLNYFIFLYFPFVLSLA